MFSFFATFSSSFIIHEANISARHMQRVKFGIQKFCKTMKTFALLKSMGASSSGLLQRCAVSQRCVLQ